jgi:hypothetical protein
LPPAERNAGIRRARRRKTAEGRLSTDGAYATENIRRRLRWLAHERKIPADRLPKVKCVPTEELSDFVQMHNINWNWLIGGDIKGLRDMMWARKGVPTARQLSEKIRSLPPDLEKIVREKVGPPTGGTGSRGAGASMKRRRRFRKRNRQRIASHARRLRR